MGFQSAGLIYLQILAFFTLLTMRNTLWLLAFLLLALAFFPFPAHAAPVNCTDSYLSSNQAGCTNQSQEELLDVATLPDLATLPPYDLRLVTGSQRRILRFSNAVWNRGPGTLELVGYPLSTRASSVFQKLTTAAGTAFQYDVGLLEFHPEHDHWHWDGFSLYEIWYTDARGQPTYLATTSSKVSYCMMDTRRIDSRQHPPGPETPERRQYGQCGWRKQGISPGWIDIYQSYLPGQDIDITQLPDGLYLLRSTVNPGAILAEQDASNNSASVYFSLRGSQLRPVEAREINALPAIFQNPFQVMSSYAQKLELR